MSAFCTEPLTHTQPTSLLISNSVHIDNNMLLQIFPDSYHLNKSSWCAMWCIMQLTYDIINQLRFKNTLSKYTAEYSFLFPLI